MFNGVKFNGVNTFHLLHTAWNGNRLRLTLKVATASKQYLHNFMLFHPSDVNAANIADSAFDLPNDEGRWVDTLLSGANMTVRPSTGKLTQRDLTRLLIRPTSQQARDLQGKHLSLARTDNMEWDFTCLKNQRASHPQGPDALNDLTTGLRGSAPEGWRRCRRSPGANLSGPVGSTVQVCSVCPS